MSLTCRRLLIGFLLLGTSVALATPSTLIWIPSTDIQADHTWHLGVENYFTPTAGFHAPTDVGLTYGFAGGRGEAGVDYMGGQDGPWFLNAKYLVAPERAASPAIAVGMYNVGIDGGANGFNMAYVLAAKTFRSLRLHAGYCHGNEAALGSDPDMLLLGLDRYLTKDKKWWGGIDFQSGKNAFGALNFGVAYSFADNVSLIAGYDVYNNSAAANTFTTQLDINF